MGFSLAKKLPQRHVQIVSETFAAKAAETKRRKSVQLPFPT
jgi:hypothetical protein